MELVLIAVAAVALGVVSHRTARTPGPLDDYSSWFIRQEKPALHR